MRSHCGTELHVPIQTSAVIFKRFQGLTWLSYTHCNSCDPRKDLQPPFFSLHWEANDKILRLTVSYGCCYETLKFVFEPSMTEKALIWHHWHAIEPFFTKD